MPCSPDHDLTPTLAAIRGGDRAALDRLVGWCYEPVQQAVHRRLRLRFRSNSPVASMFSTGDIVHGVFLKVLTGQIELERPTRATLIAYLVRTVENQIVDATRFHLAARRDRRLQQSPTECGERLAGAEAQSGSPFEQAWRNEHRAIFREVVDGFGDRERDLLLLRIEHGGTFEELAQVLGFNTVDAARKAFHTAKARLLVRLAARGLDVPGVTT